MPGARGVREAGVHTHAGKLDSEVASGLPNWLAVSDNPSI